MALQNRIILFNYLLLTAATLVLAYATDTWPGNGFFSMLGVIGIAAGAGYLGLGTVLLLRKDKTIARGFLFSGCTILIIGLTSFFLLNRY